MLKKKLLSDLETKTLITQSQQGDDHATELLYQANDRLVWSIVTRFKKRPYDPQDLFQIGSIGFLKAIKRFDVTYGVKFSTYAVPMIIGEIQRFLRDDGMLKVSRSTKELANKIRSENIIHEPYSIIANILDETIDHVKIAIHYLSKGVPRSLDEITNDNENSPMTLGDQISHDVNDQWFDSFFLSEELMGSLDERERDIIYRRYFKEETQADVGRLLNVSQVHVSRLEKKILQKMKVLLESEKDNEQVRPKRTVLPFSSLHKGEEEMNNFAQAAKGNRDKAVEMMAKGGYTYKEVSDMSGVPFGSLPQLKKDYQKGKYQFTPGSQKTISIEQREKPSPAFASKEEKPKAQVPQPIAWKEDTPKIPAKEETPAGITSTFNYQTQGNQVKTQKIVEELELIINILKIQPQDKNVAFSVKIEG